MLCGLRRNDYFYFPNSHHFSKRTFLHEYVLADRVLQSALEYMNDQKLTAIQRIDVDVGELLGLENESLRSAFGIVSKGSRVEDATLRIHRVKGVVECGSCGYTGGLDSGKDHHHIDPAFQCPKCGVPVKIKSGNEIKITRIV